MNPEKLKALQEQVRTGGKGSVRRKKKVMHKTAASDDKKLQGCLKKVGVNNIPGIEEVNIIKEDSTVLHFTNPKVQASLTANTFSVTGHGENKQLAEMLPGILNQLGHDNVSMLRKFANSLDPTTVAEAAKQTADDADDDVPELVENFDEASKDD